MKKIFLLVFAIILLFALLGCDGITDPTGPSSSTGSSAQDTTSSSTNDNGSNDDEDKDDSVQDEEIELIPIEDAVNIYIEKGLSKMDAMKKVAQERGISKRDVYSQLNK